MIFLLRPNIIYKIETDLSRSHLVGVTGTMIILFMLFGLYIFFSFVNTIANMKI